MKSVSKNSILVAIVLIVGLLCVWMANRSYNHSKEEIVKRLEKMFDECLHWDKDARELETPFLYMSILLPQNDESDLAKIQSADTTVYVKKTDDIKGMNSEEKKYVLSQLYLLDINPIRICSLDSLWSYKLYQDNIPVEFAIVYEAKGEKHYSVADTSFYESAWKLKEFVIGLQRDMVLNVYVKLPVSYIIAESLSVYILMLLVLGFCSASLVFWKKNKKILVSPATKVVRTGVLLGDGLLYDKENGVLIYEDQEITLTNYKLDLFNYLLENKGEFITSDTLQSRIWPDGFSTKDALMQTVKRLRMDLQNIPFLKIENLRGSGYRLLISETDQAETNEN